MSTPASPELLQADETQKDTDEKIAKMKVHLIEISRLMDNIQVNTNSIDDEVKRCETIINTTFEQLSEVLEKRQETLLKELQKTAKNKKLSLLLQMNELTNKYEEQQNTINKIDESAQNQQTESNNQDEKKQMIESLKINMQKDLISTNFDLQFNSNHSKQLIQMINHFGSISANPIPILLSLNNNGKNFVVEVLWKLPSTFMGSIDIKKTQKLRIEWSNAKQLTWNHKEFIISSDDKKENQTSNGMIQLINVGKNGTYIFRIKHYYYNTWSKNSNTKSIIINGISFDYWDNIYHGDNIFVEGKCIVKKNNIGYESAFLSNVVMDNGNNIHKWKFKVEGGHKSGSTRIFGVWRVDEISDNDNEMKKDIKVDVRGLVNTYFTNEKLVNANSDQAYGKPFGDKCREGDEIDMILDLGKLKLFYKLNGTIYGKPMDVARAKYRAVVSIYCVDDRIRLIAYRKEG